MGRLQSDTLVHESQTEGIRADLCHSKIQKKEPGQETNPKYLPTDGQYYAWHNINFGTIWHNITQHNTISTCFHPEEWHEI